MAVNQRVEVTRAFRMRGEDVGEGSVVDMDLATAQELRTAKKVLFVPSTTAFVRKPLKVKERPATQENAQVSALSAQVAVLTALVEKLTAAPKPAGKERVNA